MASSIYVGIDNDGNHMDLYCNYSPYNGVPFTLSGPKDDIYVTLEHAESIAHFILNEVERIKDESNPTP